MRLKLSEITAIKEIIANFVPKARVYLFGSRTSDIARGGDIDLFIDSGKIGLRNEIVHEYNKNDLTKLFQEIMLLTSELLQLIAKIKKYCTIKF